MLEGLDSVAWSSFAQPDWNTADEVPRALLALAVSDSQQTADAAYQRTLHAFGNNHAGTYYPVVVPALPFLGQILAEGGDWPRLATLEVLLDLLLSFEPAAGYEIVGSPGIDERELRALVFAGATELWSTIRPFANASGSQRIRQLAMEVLETIHDGPPPTTGRNPD